MRHPWGIQLRREANISSEHPKGLPMDRTKLKISLVYIAFLVLGSQALVAQAFLDLYTFPPLAGNTQQAPTGLVADSVGNLYGILEFGGNTNCASGCGQIYELTSPGGSFGAWTMEALHEFPGQSDGCFPDGQLTMDSSGALYGVTNGLSCSNPGTVFKLSPSATQSWTLETIYQVQGQGLNTVLALDTEGNVYGTNYSGAFELVYPTVTGGTWAVEQIASITGGATGGLQFYGGNLYGTTQSGGSGFGSVFELSPPSTGSTDWPVSEIVSFQGGTDGSGPAYASPLGISVVNSELIFGVT
jgi:uncharacterized repeat protein (TIGR03803 family)